MPPPATPARAPASRRTNLTRSGPLPGDLCRCLQPSRTPAALRTNLAEVRPWPGFTAPVPAVYRIQPYRAVAWRRQHDPDPGPQMGLGGGGGAGRRLRRHPAERAAGRDHRRGVPFPEPQRRSDRVLGVAGATAFTTAGAGGVLTVTGLLPGVSSVAVGAVLATVWLLAIGIRLSDPRRARAATPPGSSPARWPGCRFRSGS